MRWNRQQDVRKNIFKLTIAEQKHIQSTLIGNHDIAQIIDQKYCNSDDIPVVPRYYFFIQANYHCAVHADKKELTSKSFHAIGR